MVYKASEDLSGKYLVSMSLVLLLSQPSMRDEDRESAEDEILSLMVHQCILIADEVHS
jgi:hypothetical protein